MTSSTTGFYLSTDTTIDTSDTLLTSKITPALTAAGGADWLAYLSQTLTLPDNLTPGTYYIGAIADSPGTLSESSEANNHSNAIAITITDFLLHL